MRVFADTNFYVNLLIPLRHSEEALSLLPSIQQQNTSLPITRLLRREITNAFQRLVFDSRQRAHDFRVTSEIALSARIQIDYEMESEEAMHWQEMDEVVLDAAFESLVYRHTAKHGFRTYDIQHVASALCLGSDQFWSFDRKARQLAELEGLAVNPL